MARLTRLLSTLLIYACLALTGLPAATAADDGAEKARQLEQLRARIAALQKRFAQTQEMESRAEAELQATERAIGGTVRKLRAIDRQLLALRRDMKRLGAERTAHKTLLAGQRQHLAREARAAYAMGRQQRIKLLLNQQQPERVGRALTYFAYISGARAQRIEGVRRQLSHLRAVEASIAEKTAALEVLRKDRQRERQRLQTGQRQRQVLLDALRRELRARGSELKRLGQDEQRLQELVGSLRELLADIPAGGEPQLAFKALKGKLNWPAPGALAQGFGARRAGSGLRSRGVIIKAPEGVKVHAVSHGRVAFADWLRGFGLLLIIDHGDGYMSLYGHNQALYKEVGEWVDTGEVVAVLGSSGGLAGPGLYFELRHNGRPVDPLRWCAGRPQPAG